jgi:hypothetical protein
MLSFKRNWTGAKSVMSIIYPKLSYDDSLALSDIFLNLVVDAKKHVLNFLTK